MDRTEKLNEILKRRISERNELLRQQKEEIDALKKNVLALEPRIREVAGIYGLLRKLGASTAPINNGPLKIDYEHKEYLLKDSANTGNYIYLRTDRIPYSCDFGIVIYSYYENNKKFLLAILENFDEYEKKVFDFADKFIEEERKQREKAERTFYVQAMFEVRASSESDAISKIWSTGKQTVLRID